MITFVIGLILGLIAGLAIGANNANRVRKAMNELEIAAAKEISELKARLAKK